MIRICETKKNVLGLQGGSSCCSWLGEEEARNQREIEIETKKRPILYSKKVSNVCLQEGRVVESKPQGPTKTELKAKKSINSKSQLTGGTTPTKESTRTSTIINLHSLQPVKNPLLRLQKLLKKDMKSSILLERKLATSISFEQLPLESYVKIIQNQSTIFGTSHQTYHMKQGTQNELKRQVQAYQEQYAHLLREENQLINKRQASLLAYKKLLKQLSNTKYQLAELQQLRKQQIQFLRDQIDEFLAYDRQPQN